MITFKLVGMDFDFCSPIQFPFFLLHGLDNLDQILGEDKREKYNTNLLQGLEQSKGREKNI